MSRVFEIDAYTPKEIAERVNQVGVAKARLPLVPMALLGVLAGAFIGLGAAFFTLVASDASLGYAAGRVLGGLVFSLGLLLVVVAGAELFTGNNLLVMAWAEGRIRHAELLRSWAVVYAANTVGAVGLAVLVALSGYAGANSGAVGAAALRIAAAKCAMPWDEALVRGILCNLLVCLAVWLAMAGHSVADKAVAVVFPVTAFVAMGFEHSIANLYFIPLALLLEGQIAAPPGLDLSALGMGGLVRNLVPVTVGNVVGGGVLVALVYHLVYRRNLPPPEGVESR